MANDLGRLVYRIDGDLRPLDASMARAERQFVGSAGRMGTAGQRLTATVTQMSGPFLGLARAILPLAGAAGLVAVARGAIASASSFEQLELRLQTVEGSALAARQALDLISDFAAETPFDVQNITEAWIRLQAVGIRPSRELLAGIGDIAAAMGKDITEFADAVVAATTGEMERLKQFGIVAKMEGEQVKFIFKGVETSVARNAAAIVDHLMSIAESDFAGAMERQSDSLEGSISNLRDAWDQFAKAVLLDTGALEAGADALRALGEGVTNLRGELKLAGFVDFTGAAEELSALEDKLEGLQADRELAVERLPGGDRSATVQTLDARIAAAQERIAVLTDIVAQVDTLDARMNRFASSDIGHHGAPGTVSDVAAPNAPIPPDDAGLLDDRIAAYQRLQREIASSAEARERELEAWQNYHLQLQNAADEAAGFRIAVVQREKFIKLAELEDFAARYPEFEAAAAELRVAIEADAQRQIREIREEEREAFVADYREGVEAAKEERERLLEAERAATEETRDAVRDLGLTFTSAFEDAVIEGNNLRDVLKGMLQDLARLALRQGVTEPGLEAGSSFFSSMLGGLLGGSGGGVAASQVGVASYGSSMPLPIPHFAAGGVPSVGTPSLVGEKGPELFIPKIQGRVIPADQTRRALAGGSGGGAVVHLGGIHVDARGAGPEVEGVVRRVIGEETPSLINAAIAGVADERSRGGAMGAALGG